jgi:cytoskeletal protein CcmA (bactofilin family)
MKRYKRRIGDTVEGPATYLAGTSKIIGQISGKGSYVVCGAVEGDCDIDGPVSLSQGAQWRGTLRANDIVIAGTVDGDVIARDRIEIAGTARIAGSITGNSIAIAEGAVIEGEMRVKGGGDPRRFTEKRKSRSDDTKLAE